MVKSDPMLMWGDLYPAGIPSRMKVTPWQAGGSCLVQHWQAGPCLVVLPSRLRRRHPPYHRHTTMHKGMHRSLGAHESRARWQGVVGGVREGQEGKGGGAGWRQEAPPPPAPVPGACWGSDLPAGRFQPAGYFHTRLVPPPSPGCL